MMQVVHATRTCRNQAEVDYDVPMLLKTGSRFNELRLAPLEGPVDLRETKADFVGPGAPDTLYRPLEGRKISVQYGFVVPCPRIDRVVVAGGDKPMHPDWVRSIRDQCAAAGVEFCFESWGEWCPLEAVGATSYRPWTLGDGKIVGGHLAGQVVRVGYFTDKIDLLHVGREHSGRTLDGRTHDGQTVNQAVPDQTTRET